jgi:F0F1-type ATP synthase assembly protein I
MPREDLGWSSLLGMGAASAAVLVIGIAIGWFVDRALATSPLFLLVGLALGITAACFYTISQFRKYMSD